jgi:glutathione S-transferase
MLALHEYTPSQNCWKVRVLLGLLGIPYRSAPVAIFSGASRTPEFLQLNPAGSTPALQLDDGRAIAESNAILCWLGEGTRYMPAANSPDGRYARAKVMQWLFFEQYYVEPVIGSLRFWTLTGRLDVNKELVPGKRDAAVRALAALERTLAKTLFLAGTEFTIADIANYAYAHLAGDCGFPLAGFPSIARWADRVAGIIGPGYPVVPYGPEARPS